MTLKYDDDDRVFKAQVRARARAERIVRRGMPAKYVDDRRFMAFDTVNAQDHDLWRVGYYALCIARLPIPTRVAVLAKTNTGSYAMARAHAHRWG